MLDRDRGTIVLDGHLKIVTLRFLPGYLDVEMPPGYHGFERVLEDAEEDLLHLRFVAPHQAEVGAVILCHANTVGLHLGGDHRQRVLDQIWRAAWSPMKL